MNLDDVKQTLRGPMIPVITNLREDLSVDHEAIVRNVAYVVERGVARFADKLAVVDNQGMAVMNHLLGGTGFITHLCAIWPEHDLAVWDLLEQGDYAAAQRKITTAHWPWLDFRRKMWHRTGSESPVVKAALDLCGRPGGPSRLPTRSLNDEERSELRELLASIGVPGLV
jgi:dihydrodipicolinate synthase/N-acetylneuraminate lyase